VLAGAGNDTIFGGQNDGPASLDAYGQWKMMEGVEVIEAGGGADLIYGQFGAEYLIGGTGQDTIFGGQGDDSIVGEIGDDHIFGNRGNDIMSGGSGADVFYFAGEFGNDTVSDFAIGTDIAQVSGEVTSTTTDSGNTTFEFTDGSSIEFISVIMTSSDLVFV
jgi:Ca2+-binding RTX toxin-like protein